LSACKNTDFRFPGKSLKFYHLNIRSLLPKLDELRGTNGICNNEASVLCFSETHLSSNISDNTVQLLGYNVFRKDRCNRAGGGVAAYVHNDLHCVNRTEFESEHTESLWLEILQKGSSPLLLCFV
jgi:exonuclease III